MQRPLIIGITGSIASGKTEVSELLAEKGFKVFSTDGIGHKILYLKAVRHKLVEEFSDKILDHNGLVDRKKLSKVVFESSENLKVLNSITHSAIFKQMNNIINNTESEIILFEVPLLFETNLEKHFDFIITVSATPENQLTRLMKRNNLTEEEAIQKISSQLSNKLKEEKADYVIKNNGDIEELELQVKSLSEIFPTIKKRDIAPF